jgi:hypothetical protein
MSNEYPSANGCSVWEGKFGADTFDVVADCFGGNEDNSCNLAVSKGKGNQGRYLLLSPGQWVKKRLTLAYWLWCWLRVGGHLVATCINYPGQIWQHKSRPELQ